MNKTVFNYGDKTPPYEIPDASFLKYDDSSISVRETVVERMLCITMYSPSDVETVDNLRTHYDNIKTQDVKSVSYNVNGKNIATLNDPTISWAISNRRSPDGRLDCCETLTIVETLVPLMN